MKLLQTYQRNGYTFTVDNRIGNHAAYEGTKAGHASTYETIAIQHHNGREIHGKQIPPAEYPPSNAEWGSKGWTYSTEEKAKRKLIELVSL